MQIFLRLEYEMIAPIKSETLYTPRKCEERHNKITHLMIKVENITIKKGQGR